MTSKLLPLFLLAAGSMFAGPRVFFGIGFGGPRGYYAPPPPPPVVAYAQPVYPGPGYAWVAGYWYPVGPRYYWHAGYWARRPYVGAYWVAPRYRNHRYYGGYWRR
jgi:hypothetical protein